ncbi:MAG: hypothetical protein JST75_21035 [Bacteroidetes bacterium]|nr:hypothetical protein [Bacteroidota bacterium]
MLRFIEHGENEVNQYAMRITLTIFLSFVLFAKTEAQTNNSPYSVIGIGDIEDSYFNRTSGMANTGIAYRNNHSLISNNPASFSGLENQFFMGEIGIRGKLINYSGNAINANNNSSTDITFKRFALGIKLTRHWGTSIGLVPFSSENYEFNAQQPILGTSGESTTAYSQGYGGVNRVYWTNAYEFFQHLSVGINTSYLFGSLQQKTILQNPNTPSTYISTNRNIFLSNIYFDYGIQYYGHVGKKWDISVGATFANRTNLNSENHITILNSDSVALKDETLSEGVFKLPRSYGVGFSLTKNKKYTFLADYKYQDWSALNYSGFNYSLQSSDRISVGFEISHKKNLYNTSVETNFLHAGLYYGNSYLNVFGQSIKDMGATLGIGINAKRSLLSYNIILQYGIKGTDSYNLIQERYVNLTFVISYRDLWYTRGVKMQ